MPVVVVRGAGAKVTGSDTRQEGRSEGWGLF